MWPELTQNEKGMTRTEKEIEATQALPLTFSHQAWPQSVPDTSHNTHYN